MKNFSLSSVLILMLTVPLMMAYRLSPGQTPFGLFGLVFGLILVNLILDLISLRPLTYRRLKDFLLWAIILLTIGSAYFSSILVRHKTAPGYMIHDIILQQEAAVRFLLNGVNPYATDYFGTHLEGWHYSDTAVNPALYHLVMMPGYLLLALPFRLFFVPLFGFWDGRQPLFFLFLVMLLAVWKLLKEKPEERRQLLSLLAFNPATLGYFIEGRSDIFMFAFLVWGFYWLEKNRLSLAGVTLAVAFAVKQSAWPVFPFYLAYLWHQGSRRGKMVRQIKELGKKLLPFAVTFGTMVLPFAFWDTGAFWQSTVGYLSGKAEHSYPVSGYGWGMVLKQWGLVKDATAYYPFWIWQLIFGLPLLLFLLKWLSKRVIVSRLITCYGIFTFVFWYFSRYFNNSHLGYLSMVFLTAFFWPAPKNAKG